MPIKRAVKCAGLNEQLRAALKIAKKTDIKAVEIQGLLNLIDEQPTERRARTVVGCLENNNISGLAYHFPIQSKWYNFDDAKQYDLSYSCDAKIFGMTTETIREAAMVGHALGLDEAIVNIHLFGFVKRAINKDMRARKLRIGEKNLRRLHEAAIHYGEEYGCRIKLTRENNPPDHGLLPGMVDFAPEDIVRTTQNKIGVCVDFAHLEQYVNYGKRGKGQLPGVDMSFQAYGKTDVKDALTKLGDKGFIWLVHMNDACGFKKEGEGIEVGRGRFPHDVAVPLICRKADNPIGTYEVKYGHLDPESMLRCDKSYRKLFGKDFDKYFC